MVGAEGANSGGGGGRGGGRRKKWGLWRRKRAMIRISCSVDITTKIPNIFL